LRRHKKAEKAEGEERTLDIIAYEKY